MEKFQNGWAKTNGVCPFISSCSPCPCMCQGSFLPILVPARQALRWLPQVVFNPFLSSRKQVHWPVPLAVFCPPPTCPSACGSMLETPLPWSTSLPSPGEEQPWPSSWSSTSHQRKSFWVPYIGKKESNLCHWVQEDFSSLLTWWWLLSEQWFTRCKLESHSVFGFIWGPIWTVHECLFLS